MANLKKKNKIKLKNTKELCTKNRDFIFYFWDRKACRKFQNFASLKYILENF